MLLASSSITGVFGYFIQIQNQLQLGIPWYAQLPVPYHPDSACQRLDAHD